MPGPFEITFVRMQPVGHCRWDGIFKYNAPPNDPNWISVATNYWGITGPPPPTQEITLCTVDLSTSRCNDKCEPEPRSTSRVTSWQLSQTTDYVCQVERIAEEEVDDCIHVTFEMRVWRARLGINPLSASASGHVGGVVVPGNLSLVAGQVPHLTQPVVVQLCCRDVDDLPEFAELGEMTHPVTVQERKRGCAITCKLIAP